MGVGWEYFNNVCRAFRVAARLVGGIVGLIVLFLVGGSVMQYINANRTSDPTLIVAPTPATAPIVKPNPQFAPRTPGAPAPANPAAVPTNGSAASLNPQFGQPHPTAPTTTRIPAGPTGALPDNKPNPQFSKP